MRFKNLVLVILAVVAVQFVAPGAVLAGDFNASVKTTASVEEIAKRSNITMIVEVTNNVADATPKVITVPAYGMNVKNLTAKYQDSTSKLKATYDAKTNTIKLATTKIFTGKGKKWSFSLRYSSELAQQLGASGLVVIPSSTDAFEGVDIASESRTISLDLSLGAATRIGAQVPTTTIAVGQQVLKWSASSGLGYPTGVIFGDGALVDVKIATTLENNGLWWKTYTVVLPPDNNQQRVFIESISPKPKSVRIDIDGNILAEFKLRPKSKIEVEANAKVLVNNYTYALSKATEAISADELKGLDLYLKATEKWPATALEAEAEATTLNKIDLALTLVNATEQQGDRPLEIAVARNDQFVGILRGAGIPARAMRGLLHSTTESTPHAWSEVFVGGLGWITIDPNGINGYDTTDARYVALLIRGARDSYPPSRVSSTINGYIEGTELPKSTDKPQLASTTYMILPGFGLRATSVTMPSGMIIDSTGLKISNNPVNETGSLAPLGTAVVKDLTFGPDSFKAADVSYGVFGPDGNYVGTDTAVSKLSWIPFIAIIGLVVLTVFVNWLWPKIRAKFPKKQKPDGLQRKRSRFRQLMPMKYRNVDEINHSNLVAHQQPPATAEVPTAQPQPSYQKPVQHTAALEPTTQLAPHFEEPLPPSDSEAQPTSQSFIPRPRRQRFSHDKENNRRNLIQ